MPHWYNLKSHKEGQKSKIIRQIKLTKYKWWQCRNVKTVITAEKSAFAWLPVDEALWSAVQAPSVWIMPLSSLSTQGTNVQDRLHSALTFSMTSGEWERSPNACHGWQGFRLERKVGTPLPSHHCQRPESSVVGSWWRNQRWISQLGTWIKNGRLFG